MPGIPKNFSSDRKFPPLSQSKDLKENNMGGPEKGRVDMSKRTYARSPRIRRASWISFGIMVTLLA